MKSCDKCPDSACCRDVTVGIDEPETIKDWDEIRWMVAHQNVMVYLDNEDDWVVEFKTDCTKLEDNGKCKIYNNRPHMCSNHSPENCVFYGEGDVWKLKFETIEEVEKHIKEKVKPKMIKKLEKDLEKAKKWLE